MRRVAFAALPRRIARILRRRAYPYADTLQRISAEIGQYPTVAEAAAYALDQLGRALGVSWATLTLHAELSAPSRYTWGDAPDAQADGGADAMAGREVALEIGGAPIGTLTIGPPLADGGLISADAAFLATVAPLVAIALHNIVLKARLHDQVAARAARERALAALTTQLIQIQEDERQRIALDLHDDPLQRALLLARELSEAAATPPVQRWRQAAEDIVAALRAVCAGLRPAALDDLGLIAGIEWLVNDMRARTELEVDLEVSTVDGEPFGRLEPDLEIALYRVTQEALTNCRKHAQASQVVVRLQRDAQQALLQIADDGRGVEAGAARGAPAVHLGILGMHQRLRLWPNDITVERGVYGGTTVSVRVALRRKRDDAA